MTSASAAVEQALVRRAETGGPGYPREHLLAHGDGWSVADVVCASGPHDRPFVEERGREFVIAIVAAGVFEYRSALGSELMTPGSAMFGAPAQSFECRHGYGAGDRCVAFSYDPAFFERLASDAGAHGGHTRLTAARLPPLPAVTPFAARALAGITGAPRVPWEEFAIQVGARVVGWVLETRPSCTSPSRQTMARVAEIVRLVDRHPDGDLKLERLAREAGLSPYHFLRTFARVTGVTPHQYVLRARLREAARRLATGPARIIDVALDCGFGDVSNFDHAFRAEFGVTPRRYRVASSE